VPTPFANDLAGGHTWARRDQTWGSNNRALFLQLYFGLDSGNVGAFFLVRPRIR
jgi:hypothetical protein